MTLSYFYPPSLSPLSLLPFSLHLPPPSPLLFSLPSPSLPPSTLPLLPLPSPPLSFPSFLPSPPLPLPPSPSLSSLSSLPALVRGSILNYDDEITIKSVPSTISSILVKGDTWYLANPFSVSLQVWQLCGSYLYLRYRPCNLNTAHPLVCCG